MLKYLSGAVTFAEFPDEIAYCLNITNCPCHCPKCSEPELREDTGIEVTSQVIDQIIHDNPGISLIGFMGGDSDHESILKLSEYIHSKGLKVGFYSGFEYLDYELLGSLDYYKIGRWIHPEGDETTWWKTNCGPLVFPFSNQLMFRRINNHIENITYRFREKPINKLSKEII